MIAKKRLIPILVAVLMAFAFIPIGVGTAYADSGDPEIVAGTDSVLKDTANTDDAQTVWYAGSAWRVISCDGTGNSYLVNSNTMTLLAADNMQTDIQFNASNDMGNDYEGSDLKNSIDGIFSSQFSGKEQKAVIERELGVDEFFPVYPYSTGVSGTISSGFLWPLSAAEAEALPSDTFRSTGDYWWLRSPGNDVGMAADVNRYGQVRVSGDAVRVRCAVRPAFDLNTSSVLFTSAAEGGCKASDTLGVFNEVGENTTGEWKLTIKDDGSITGLDGHKDFAIADPYDFIYDPEMDKVHVPYSGAVTGENEFISAIITDSNGNIKYYGRISTASDNEHATVAISISDIGVGDKLYVFNEQYNGEKSTDFASALQEVEVPYRCEMKVFIHWDDNDDAQGKRPQKVGLHLMEGEEELDSGVAEASGTGNGWFYSFGQVPIRDTQGNLIEYSIIVDDVTYSDGYGSYQTEVIKKNQFSFNVWNHYIAKPKLTITAKDQTYEYNGQKQGPGDMAYDDAAEIAELVSVEGLQEGDSLTSIVLDGEGDAVGEYQIEPNHATINGAPADEKYEVSYVNGTLRITEPVPVNRTLLAKLTAKGKTDLVLTWSKVKDVDGYDIFFIKCGKASPKKVKTISGNKTFKWTKSNLKTKYAYKACVKAYVKKDGKKTYVTTSPVVHAYTTGGTKSFTNAKSVTVNKESVSVKTGKTYMIRANVTKLQNGKKLMPTNHEAKLRYISSNKKIATVSKSGRITAKSKGSCKIYVIAVNGARKTVSVTVK